MSDVDKEMLYGWHGDEHEVAHSYLSPFLSNLIRETMPKSILDIGAGNGSLTRVILHDDFEVAAMEPSVDGFQRVKGLAIDCRRLSTEDAAPDDWLMKFEFLYAIEVVEHLYNPDSLFQFARSCAAEGAKFAVSTPYHGYVKNLAISVLGGWDAHWTPLRLHGHIKFWSVKTMTELGVRNGWRVSSVSYLGRIRPLAKSMAIVFELNE